MRMERTARLAVIASVGMLTAQGCAPGCGENTAGKTSTAGGTAPPTVTMNLTATEKSASYELVWSLSTTAAGDALKLDYTVKAIEELYLSDRPWDDDANRRRVADPHGIYRFVRNGSLRLVLAHAPYPPNVRLGKYYPPLYSRLRAGESRHQSVVVKLPVDEYSILARDVRSPTVVEEVSKVVFVLGYRLRSSMDRDPKPPSGESEEAGFVVYEPQLIVSELHVGRLPVKRRTGYIARFPLPGEPGPEPMPAELLR